MWEKKSWIHPFIQMRTKSKQDLFWAEVNNFWGGTSAALGVMHLFRMKLGTVWQ